MEKHSSDSAGTEAAQRILAVAERLFGERGFNGVSISHIADAAGVSKANVFHHYSSKLSLYEAVLQRGSIRTRSAG
jgi:TetR/AcrR family transcriptional regulator